MIPEALPEAMVEAGRDVGHAAAIRHPDHPLAPRPAVSTGAVRTRARSPAAAAARVAQQRLERVLTRARACVRPADRPRRGLGSCRTRRPAHAPLGGRAQTDAIRDRSGRRFSAVQRALSQLSSSLRICVSFTIKRRAPSTSRLGLRDPASSRLRVPDATKVSFSAIPRVRRFGRSENNFESHVPGGLSRNTPYNLLTRSRTTSLRSSTIRAKNAGRSAIPPEKTE